MSQEKRFDFLKDTADKQFKNLLNSQNNIKKLEEINNKLKK
jgi:hypothetical protein